MIDKIVRQEYLWRGELSLLLSQLRVENIQQLSEHVMPKANA